MPLWGNTDAANNEPHFPELREVRVVTSLTTTNAVLAGNKVWFSANVPSTVVANMWVYGADDANNAISRVNKDLSFFDQNDIGLWKSNNTVAAVSGNTITLTNNVAGTYGAGKTVYFAQNIVRQAGPDLNAANDTILITSGRMANKQGTTYGGGSTVANTRIGNTNAGWNRIIRKINNDGTVRFLKETLVALANPVASNTSSANSTNCVMSEFESDIKRTKYLKRLFRRYKVTKSLKERLILNHLILLNNVFGPEPTARILFYRIDVRDYDILKTFLVYLNLMPEIVFGINGKNIHSDTIKLDMGIAEILRKI